jgi:hypothetical protein
VNYSKGFTTPQLQEFNRGMSVKKYLHNYQPVVNTKPPLVNRQNELTGSLEALENKAAEKIYDTKGITTGKKRKKLSVAQFYDRICADAREFLLDQNSDNAGNFRITKRTLTHLKEGEVLPIAMQINKWVEEYCIPNPAFASYGITSATLAEGLALARDFDKTIGEADLIDAGKSGASQTIAQLITRLKTTLERIELLVRSFQQTNPEFYKGFYSANKLDHTGLRHNIIKGRATLDGQPLHKATIACDIPGKPSKSCTTNRLGYYKFPRLRPGPYQFTCTAQSLDPITQIITVKRGKTQKINWEFKTPNPVSGSQP